MTNHVIRFIKLLQPDKSVSDSLITIKLLKNSILTVQGCLSPTDFDRFDFVQITFLGTKFEINLFVDNSPGIINSLAARLRAGTKM